MTERSEPLDPAEAFKTTGNETRLAILRELVASKHRPLTFTELRKRVGLRDASQFNYHLTKLEPGFVVRTDEGFHISHAGAQVIRAIAAGTFTEHPTIPPFAVDGECVVCGGTLLAHYEQEVVFVNCADCEQPHYMTVFSPGGLVGRTTQEGVATSDRKMRSGYLPTMAGICPTCDGRNRRTVVGDTDHLPESVKRVKTAEFTDYLHGPGISYECEQCDVWYYLTMGEALLFEPAVVEFFGDHGYDLNEVRLWTLPWCIPAASHGYATILSEDPLHVEVRIPLGDETLLVTIDEDLEVVPAERTSDAPPAATGDAG